MIGESLGDLFVRVGFDPSGLDSGATAIEKRLEQVGTRLYFLGSRITASFSAPLGVAVGMIAKFGIDFDQAMTESLAIMDNVSNEMRKKMEKQARDIAETSKFTSTEAAKAYFHLASAGLDAAQATTALPVAARFAQAGMMDLAKATEFLSGAQAALGLRTKDATENQASMARISDVLTQANIRALGTAQDFAAALENKAAPQLRLFHKSVEEGVAVLEAYAVQGVKGRTAGSQLYMLLRDLAVAAVRHGEAFKQAGIEVFDSSGKMRNMADIIADMEKKLGPMNDQARITELRFLGLTDRSRSALLPLIGMSSQIREFQKDLESAGGITQKVADKQMMSLENQLHRVQEAFKNIAIELFQSFLPVIENRIMPLIQAFVDKVREWAHWLESLSETHKVWVMSLVAAGIALGPILTMMGGLVLVYRVILAPVMELVRWFSSFLPVAAKAAEGATAIGEGFNWLGLAGRALAAFASPWVAIPASIAAVALALRYLAGSWQDVWNIFSAFFPPLKLLPGVFDAIVSTGKGVYSILSDIGAILGGVVKIGFSYVTDALKWISAHSDIIAKGGVDFVLYASGIGQARDAFVKIKHAMEDWFPVISRGEDWLKRKLGEGLEWARNKLHELAEAFRNFEAMINGLDVKAPKPNIGAPAAPVQRPGGGTVDDYLDRIYGTSGGGAGADSPATARMKNIADRISGKTAFEDANAWMEAIKKVGGVGKLATEDLDAALKVFDTAYDRAVRLKGANSDLARSYGTIWGVLQQIKEQQGGANFDSAAGVAALGFHPSITDMQADAAMGVKMASGRFGVGNDPFAGVGWRRSPADIKNDMPQPASFTREWAAAVAKMGTVASEMNRLGKEVGGSFGTILMGLGTFFTIAQTAGRSGITMKSSFDQMTDAKGNSSSKTAGGVNMALAGIEAFASWSAATNSKSMKANVAGGAMAGASAGSAFGVVGTLVGASIGAIGALIKGKPEWAKLQSDIARDMGIKISDELAQALAADSKKFGRAATSEIHLSELIGAAGGLDASNLDKFTGKLRDTFVLLGQGQLTMAQSTKVLNDNFANFVTAGTDGYGRLSKDLKEIISLNDTFGTQSKAIADYLKGQGSAALDGFNQLVAGSTAAGAGELKDLANNAITFYAAAVASGMTEAQALNLIAPSLKTIGDRYKELGLDVDNVAFKSLAFQSGLVEKNPAVMGALSGLTSGMVALDNMGLLNVSTFESMERSGFQMFGRLLASATDMGGGAKEALVPMQDWLHQAKIQAELLNVPLDAGTQSLIDQSVQLGIWKEKGKSATDKMLDGVTKLIDKMDILISRLYGIPDGHTTIHVNYDVAPPPDLPGGGGGNDSGVPDWPQMARGGVVTRPTRVVVGEGAEKEAIMPLSALESLLNGGGNGPNGPSSGGSPAGGGGQPQVYVDARGAFIADGPSFDRWLDDNVFSKMPSAILRDVGGIRRAGTRAFGSK